MLSRYLRRRVWISYDGEEEAIEAVVLDSFKELDCWYYRIKRIDGGAIVDLKTTSINFIMHRRSEVIPLTRRFRVVK